MIDKLNNIKKGQNITYFIGELSRRLQNKSEIDVEYTQILNIKNKAYNMYIAEKVDLVQKRVSQHGFAYIAIGK